jgi:exodeoxyribonuclease VII large subunit
VTGIGHEIDFTIADFVADKRAPTPSVAAETVSPDRFELMQTVDDYLRRILIQASQQLSHDNGQVAALGKRLQLQHPHRQFQTLKLRLNYAYEALLERNRNRLASEKQRLRFYESTIAQFNPLTRVRQQRETLNLLRKRSNDAIKQHILVAKHGLALQAKSLDALSPLKTLSRGFARISKNQKLVNSVGQLYSGDDIDITLSDGNKKATIR